MPGLIGERLYMLLDEDKNGYIDKKELVKGMLKIYFSHLESRFHLVFNMYDFDGDGKICKEDIILLLSHVPITTVRINKLICLIIGQKTL